MKKNKNLNPPSTTTPQDLEEVEIEEDLVDQQDTRRKEGNSNKGVTTETGGYTTPTRTKLILNSDERLRNIFHPGNVRDIPGPKLNNGNYVCQISSFWLMPYCLQVHQWTFTTSQ